MMYDALGMIETKGLVAERNMLAALWIKGKIRRE